MNAFLQLTTATSGTVNIQDTKQNVVLAHDGTVATLNLTIAFPPNPRDGQTVIITSGVGITTVSLTTVIGTIVGALTTITLTSPGRYIYSDTRKKWFRY